jgi:5-methylcytosine-specific restriction enzyme subunit McrC
MDKMISLFEYQNKVRLSKELDGLEEFLDEIWAKRERNPYFRDEDSENERVESQRFLQFLHKSKEIKSNKYVGVIHFNGERINLFPKIFYESEHSPASPECEAIQLHILWWLSYCQRIKFPKYNSALSSHKSDFFEVLIYLFAKYTRELLGHSIYQQYEETRREMQFVRGRLDINSYIRQNLSKGRWHKVNCVFDPFVFDNRFNQIIRYVAKMLLSASVNTENKKKLREILFILDGVSDFPATAEECKTIQFNPTFEDFVVVRDYCQLFLEHAVSLDYNNNLKLFAFLIPMEILFEDFVYGFIEKEVQGIISDRQVRSKNLDTGNVFGLQPDLLLKTPTSSIIADTKYKMVYKVGSDKKNGIRESDLYQVLTYAIRFNINQVALLYPNTLDVYHKESASYKVIDEFADDTKIDIYAHQLPIIDRSVYDGEFDRSSNLNHIFGALKVRLTERILQLFIPN